MPFYYATRKQWIIGTLMFLVMVIGIPSGMWAYGIAESYAQGIDPFKSYPETTTVPMPYANHVYSRQSENDTNNYHLWCLKNGVWVDNQQNDNLPYCENIYGEKIHQ